jgi:hypothetical protein
MARGRELVPTRLRFTTYTLRYSRCAWLSLEGLGHHWEKARVDANIEAQSRIVLKTANVTELSLHFAPGECPLDVTVAPQITIDGQKVAVSGPQSDRSWNVSFEKPNGRWSARTTQTTAQTASPSRKAPGLQGPIDDAFWDSFVMVRPTGQPINEKVGAWSAKEMEHAVVHWRRQFRGDARVIDDTAVTDDAIAASNLVLWGDPSSNKVLARIADRLPVKWTGQSVTIGPHSYPSDHHVPVLIFPNPLNPKRYIVLNSGFTFREYDYLNNARQVPKLPDWAIVDISKPVTSRLPGGIAEAGFFGEQWEYVEPPKGK